MPPIHARVLLWQQEKDMGLPSFSLALVKQVKVPTYYRTFLKSITILQQRLSRERFIIYCMCERNST